jgi:hypothetical protein
MEVSIELHASVALRTFTKPQMLLVRRMDISLSRSGRNGEESEVLTLTGKKNSTVKHLASRDDE